MLFCHRKCLVSVSRSCKLQFKTAQQNFAIVCLVCLGRYFCGVRVFTRYVCITTFLSSLFLHFYLYISPLSLLYCVMFRCFIPTEVTLLSTVFILDGSPAVGAGATYMYKSLHPYAFEKRMSYIILCISVEFKMI